MKRARARWTGVGMLVSLGALVATEACLLTTNFDGVAGTRPADGGDEADVVVDAGIEGGPVNCATETHLICTDFDHGGLTSTGWDSQLTGAGKTAIDTTEFVSAPDSFRSTIPAVTDTSRIGGILHQEIKVDAYTALRFAFDMYIYACAAPAGSTTVAALQPTPATAFGVVLVNNTWTLGQLITLGGAFNSIALDSALPTKRWFRLAVRLELSATRAHGVLTVDGVTMAENDFEPRTPGASTILNIGANASGPVGACDIDYDNVTFDKE